MTAKVRIKFGQFEIDYEGDEKFLEKDLVDLATQVVNVFKDHAKILTEKPSPSSSDRTFDSAKKFDDTLSTNTIASKLDVKTGPELILAAAAYLALVQGKATFSRKEIMEEMKNATTFFRSSYLGGNLTKYLNTLVNPKKQLNLVRQDTYSLTAEAKRTLEAVLAE